MAIVLPNFSGHRAPATTAVETTPAVSLKLCRDDAMYVASESMSFDWRVCRVDPNVIDAVELSVLWHTDGKGDQDLAVHGFWRYDQDKLLTTDDKQSTVQTCQLPDTPLSYQGHLVSIRWAVRLRLFIKESRSIKTEVPFLLVAHRPTVR